MMTAPLKSRAGELPSQVGLEVCARRRVPLRSQSIRRRIRGEVSRIGAASCAAHPPFFVGHLSCAAASPAKRFQSANTRPFPRAAPAWLDPYAQVPDRLGSIASPPARITRELRSFLRVIDRNPCDWGA